MQTVIEQLKNSLVQTEAHANHMRSRIQSAELDIQVAADYLVKDQQYIAELRAAIEQLEASALATAARVAEIPLLAQ